MTILNVLLINTAVSTACFIGLWLISLRIRDVSMIDSWWALGIVVLALSTFLQTGLTGPRQSLLVMLCMLWGLRLGLYLFWRWRSHGPDRRYATILGKAQSERGWGFAKAGLILVFALQGPIQFVVALPVQLGQIGYDGSMPGVLAWAGTALAVAGILFESISDLQLVRFKRNPANAGRILDSGLWRYTRHPNYFGDACVWWGLYLIAAETRYGIWTLPAPILMTLLLTRWSGVPTVEGPMKRKRAGYDDYMKRTSVFVPLVAKARGVDC